MVVPVVLLMFSGVQCLREKRLKQGLGSVFGEILVMFRICLVIFSDV